MSDIPSISTQTSKSIVKELSPGTCFVYIDFLLSTITQHNCSYVLIWVSLIHQTTFYWITCRPYVRYMCPLLTCSRLITVIDYAFNVLLKYSLLLTCIQTIVSMENINEDVFQ